MILCYFGVDEEYVVTGEVPMVVFVVMSVYPYAHT